MPLFMVCAFVGDCSYVMDNLLAAKNQEAEDILYDALDNQD
jgi:hypothetical protein